MIRVLIMITAAGFVLSVAALSAAFAIGGPDLIARGGWNIADGHWGHNGWRNRDWDHDWPGDRHGSYATGPQTSRTLEWSGADSLDIDLAANVRYIQSEGPASVTVTRPQRAVERVIVRGDSIRYARGKRRWHGPKLDIVVRAPGVMSFDLSGRNTLAIEGYRQDRLRLEVSGDATVTASGETGDIDLEVTGSSEADLGALKSKGAQVEASGATEVTVAPTDWAKLEVSGASEVRLLTQPKSLETDVSGAGKVRQDAPRSSTPAPPPAPAPPAKGAKL